MRHLRILDFGIACDPDCPYVHSGKKIVGWEDIDEVDCPDCKATLGDRSVIQEGMTKAECLRAVHATMTDEEKAESLARVHDLTSDTCPSCGGSIRHDEHSDDCLGPDPDEWQDKLTPEQVDAELRVLGVYPVAAAAKLRGRLDQLEAEALARLPEENHDDPT